MKVSGISIENEVRDVLDHISPRDNIELRLLFITDPEVAYIKAKLYKDLYWQDDIGEYEIEGCGI